MSALTRRTAVLGRQDQLRVWTEIPRPNLSVSLNQTFAARQKIGNSGSKPPFAAVDTKVGYGPFASSDTGERIADFLLCISTA